MRMIHTYNIPTIAIQTHKDLVASTIRLDQHRINHFFSRLVVSICFKKFLENLYNQVY